MPAIGNAVAELLGKFKNLANYLLLEVKILVLFAW